MQCKTRSKTKENDFITREKSQEEQGSTEDPDQIKNLSRTFGKWIWRDDGVDSICEATPDATDNHHHREHRAQSPSTQPARAPADRRESDASTTEAVRMINIIIKCRGSIVAYWVYQPVAQIWVWATQLPSQFPVNEPGKATGDSPVTGPLPPITHLGDQDETPGFRLAQLWPLRLFGEWMSGRKASL